MEEYQQNFQNYFFLDRRIKKSYEDLEDLRYRHENKNRYTSVVYNEALGTFYSKNYNMEYDVIDFVEAENLVIKRIERIKKRINHFENLINDLDPIEKEYLVTRYKEGRRIKEQPHVEEQALSIVKEMEEYKFEISNYNQNRYDRAELFKEQQEAKRGLENKKQNEVYDEWLDNIMEDKELAERWEKNGILERLRKLGKSSVREGDLEEVSNR